MCWVRRWATTLLLGHIAWDEIDDYGAKDFEKGVCIYVDHSVTCWCWADEDRSDKTGSGAGLHPRSAAWAGRHVGTSGTVGRWTVCSRHIPAACRHRTRTHVCLCVWLSVSLCLCVCLSVCLSVQDVSSVSLSGFLSLYVCVPVCLSVQDVSELFPEKLCRNFVWVLIVMDFMCKAK